MTIVDTTAAALPAPVLDRARPALAALDRMSAVLLDRDVAELRAAVLLTPDVPIGRARAVRRIALATLARALPDLLVDDLLDDAGTVLVALTPGRSAGSRRRLWDQATEAMAALLALPSADMDLWFDRPLPWGTSAEATRLDQIIVYTAQLHDALGGLVAP